MNTRFVNVKRAGDLRTGDIIDTRTIGFMYGFRYYRVLREPVQCNVHPEIVNVRLAVLYTTAEELTRNEPLDCNMRVESQTAVRVCLRLPPRQRPSYGTRYFNVHKV